MRRTARSSLPRGIHRHHRIHCAWDSGLDGLLPLPATRAQPLLSSAELQLASGRPRCQGRGRLTAQPGSACTDTPASVSLAADTRRPGLAVLQGLTKLQKYFLNYFTLFVQAIGTTGYITFYFNPAALMKSFLLQEDFNVKQMNLLHV